MHCVLRQLQRSLSCTVLAGPHEALQCVHPLELEIGHRCHKPLIRGANEAGGQKPTIAPPTHRRHVVSPFDLLGIHG